MAISPYGHMRYLVGILLLFASSSMVLAQQPVNSTSTNGGIVATSTFQSIAAAAVFPVTRHGCAVQNKGANNMYVYFGVLASAVSASAITLTPNSVLNCNIGGIVLQDQISITGTQGDTWGLVTQ